MTDKKPPVCFETTVALTLAAAQTLSPSDRLVLAAQIVAGLPNDNGSGSNRLEMNPDAVRYRLLLDMGATKTTNLYPAEGRAIDKARLTRDGVTITCGDYPARDMTADECALKGVAS